jgi:hypothetical protein
VEAEGNPNSLNLLSVLSVTPQVTAHSAKHTEATEGKLVLNEKYVEAWAEVCLERIGEDNPEEE